MRPCLFVVVVIAAVVEYSHTALMLTYDQTPPTRFFCVLLNNSDKDVLGFKKKNVAKVLPLFPLFAIIIRLSDRYSGYDPRNVQSPLLITFSSDSY